ncbi:MAG: HAD family hydrolase [Candidatus Heimdallarchaeota archaeon]
MTIQMPDTPNLSNMKAVIFDLDGTLVDSMPAMASLVVEGLKRLGIKISYEKFGKRLFGEFFGAPLPQGFRMIPTLMYRIGRIAGLGRLKAFLFSFEVSFQLRKSYDSAELFPDVIELLRTLQNRGISLALVSMGSRKGILKILDNTGIREYFKVIVSRDEVKKQKPDPEGYLLVQRALKITPEKIAVVGDMPIDILAAKQAGMPSIAVTTGLAQEDWFQEPALPSLIVKSLFEIQELFQT